MTEAKLHRVTGFICFALLANALAMPSYASILPDDEIVTALKERVDRDRLGPGIVVGVVDQHGSKVFAYGKMKAGGVADVNGDTLFEIGSITKTFTTLLLQKMVDDGEVRLDDPIGKFLPPSVKTPSYQDKEITLLALATHTSGLPDVPFSSWHMLWHAKDPYAGFGPKELYKYLSHYKISQPIGASYEYSNLGMELLGQILALKARASFEDLVIKCICEPLQMKSTCITLSPALQSRFASGHNESGRPAGLWSSPLPGDGALRSSANDLLKYLSAELSLNPSPLVEAMAKTQIPRYPIKNSPEAAALGWVVDTNTDLVWHNGETSGFASWIGFNKPTHIGVIVLANSENEVDEFGQTVMGLRNYHKVAKINYGLYDQYVGKYECLDHSHRYYYSITRRGDHLLVHLTGTHQPTMEILPESETHFFFQPANLRFSFSTNQAGVVASLTLKQPGATFNFIKVVK